MSHESTGYDAALAKIEPGTLSERQQRIALGLAMIRDGSTALAASKACGIPNSTLHRYHHHVSKLESKAPERMADALEDLQRGAVIAAAIATERVTERLVDPEHEWKDSDLIKAQGVNVDKALALQGRSNGPEAPGISALAQLLEAGDLTLTKRDAVKDAIDVTADPVDAEGD